MSVVNFKRVILVPYFNDVYPIFSFCCVLKFHINRFQVTFTVYLVGELKVYSVVDLKMMANFVSYFGDK